MKIARAGDKLWGLHIDCGKNGDSRIGVEPDVRCVVWRRKELVPRYAAAGIRTLCNRKTKAKNKRLARNHVASVAGVSERKSTDGWLDQMLLRISIIVGVSVDFMGFRWPVNAARDFSEKDR